jgi:hypothetical protein
MQINASVSANQMFNDIATAAMTSPELAKIRSKAEQQEKGADLFSGTKRNETNKQGRVTLVWE